MKAGMGMDKELNKFEGWLKVNLLSSLEFIFEKEKGKGLLFLDAYIETTNVGFEISAY